MSDYTNATHADGPLLAAWVQTILDRRGLALRAFPTIARASLDWRYGAPATFCQADSAATTLGYHVSELPSAVWIGTVRTERRVHRKKVPA